MFIEPAFSKSQKGWIEVICGSMFSGKSEELIRRLKRSMIARQRVEIFKPRFDTRYDEEKVVSHDKNSIASTPVDHSQKILFSTGNVDVVGVDEAQFFDDGLPEVCEKLARSGVRVIVAGLDKDYKGQPFGPMPQLLAMSDYVTKLHAVCVKCFDLATHSFRLSANEDQLLLGQKDAYEPRCRQCYYEN